MVCGVDPVVEAEKEGMDEIAMAPIRSSRKIAAILLPVTNRHKS
jgi:predicted transcriptional regulator